MKKLYIKRIIVQSLILLSLLFAIGLARPTLFVTASTPDPANQTVIFIGLKSYEQWWKGSAGETFYFSEATVSFPLLTINVPENTHLELGEISIEGLPPDIVSRAALVVSEQNFHLPEGVIEGYLLLHIINAELAPGMAWDMTLYSDILGCGTYPFKLPFVLESPRWSLNVGAQVGTLSEGESGLLHFPIDVRGLGDGIHNLSSGSWGANFRGISWPDMIIVTENDDSIEILSDGTMASGKWPFWLGINFTTIERNFWSVGVSSLNISPYDPSDNEPDNEAGSSQAGRRHGASGSMRRFDEFQLYWEELYAVAEQTQAALPPPYEASYYRTATTVLRFEIENVYDGKIMLPLDTIAEAMGLSVYWDEKTQSVAVIFEGNSFAFGVDTPTVLWDTPIVSNNNGRVLVSLSFVSRVLNLNTTVDEAENAVYVELRQTS